MRTYDIMQVRRQNYYTGIIITRVRKTKLIAKNVIEGGVYKQCENLWRYEADLTKINVRSNVKINID